MTSTTTTQTRSTRGRANRNKPKNKEAQQNKEVQQNKEAQPVIEEDDAAVCWICAEPVKFYSVSQCNHRTCHVCALRLRALYKKTDCTFCKEPQPSVVFTTSPDAPYASFSQPDMPQDTKLSITFETQEMMEETLILLRFNCPDTTCDYIGTGWNDLKLHVRALHGKMMCDMCIKFKKVFAHEHTLYSFAQLCTHLPSMPRRQNFKSVPRDQVEGGVHPFCEFCREAFFGDDELYKHMREKHEECFVCKRNEVLHQYFADYNALEKHFHTAHHPCQNPGCLAQKFVVFGSIIDLQAHMVEEHGADMSSRDKKDARRVQADFEFQRREHTPRHHPAPQPPPAPGPPASRRREAFGSSLTTHDNPPTPQTRTPSPLLGTRTDVDPATLERHNAFLSRLSSYATNPTNAVPAVKAAIRSYRASESTARDLILTIWNVVDRNLEGTASVVNAFVDLLNPEEEGEEERRMDVLSSWKGFELEQRRQFPELGLTSVGAGYAGIASGRVLNAKHLTATRSSRPSRQVWDRVARAANSSSPTPGPSTSKQSSDRFPALKPTKAAAPVAGPAFRQPARTTPWAPAPSSSSAFPPIGSSSSSANPKSSKQTPPPKLNSTSFPELPSNSGGKSKVQITSSNNSLKNIVGGKPATGNAWSTSGTNSIEGVQEEEAEVPSVPISKGKKKGKQKQTLFTTSFTPVS